MKYLSVLLPVYNSSKFLSQAINSVLRQTFSDFELLIIDDGSTDNPDKIVSEFKDKRIKFFKKKHTGTGDTLNYGLNIAESELIAIVNSDDINLQERFEMQFNTFAKYSFIDVVTCWYALFKSNRIFYVLDKKMNTKFIKDSLLLHNYINQPGVMFKKKTILDAGMYENVHFEDYALWLKLRDKANFYNVEKILVFKREHDNSTTSVNYIKNREATYKHQEKYFYNKVDDKFREKNYLNLGWREFFYGNKNISRRYFCKKYSNFLNLKIVIACIISYLPEKFFYKVLKENFIQKISYYLKYYCKSYRELRIVFKKYINEIKD